MTARAEELLSRVAAQNKHAVDLAMIASPAVRIEPAVLRSLRLEFLPLSDPSAEADLWMSPLVGVRSASAITLVPEVASALRQRLSARGVGAGKGDVGFGEAAGRIAELHADLSPLLRLEERVIRLCYESANPVDAIDAEMAPVVRTMQAQPEKAAALASWALRAIPRLPEAARGSRALWALALAGSARFGVQPLLSGDPPADAIRLVPGLLPSDVPSTRVEVRRSGATLELYWPALRASVPVQTSIEGGVSLDVPATNPVIVEVRDGTLSPIAMVLSPGQRRHLSVMSDTVRLRTLRGETFDLHFLSRGEQATRAEPAAEQARSAGPPRNVEDTAQTANPPPNVEDVAQTADPPVEPEPVHSSAETAAEVVIEGAEILRQAEIPAEGEVQSQQARRTK